MLSLTPRGVGEQQTQTPRPRNRVFSVVLSLAEGRHTMDGDGDGDRKGFGLNALRCAARRVAHYFVGWGQQSWEQKGCAPFTTWANGPEMWRDRLMPSSEHCIGHQLFDNISESMSIIIIVYFQVMLKRTYLTTN